MKFEINSKIAEVYEALRQVIHMVKENVQNEANSEGVLTQGEAKYLMCLDLKYMVFVNASTRLDEAHWAENLLMIRRQAGEIQE